MATTSTGPSVAMRPNHDWSGARTLASSLIALTRPLLALADIHIAHASRRLGKPARP